MRDLEHYQSWTIESLDRLAAARAKLAKAETFEERAEALREIDAAHVEAEDLMDVAERSPGSVRSFPAGFHGSR